MSSVPSSDDDLSQAGSRGDQTMVRVLLVEDDLDHAETVAEMLLWDDFATSIYGNGGEALDAVTHETFGVAIVDLSLPDYYGTEFIAALTARDPRIRIIINTGNSTHDAAVDALNLGAFGYLHKGGDPEEMVRTVRRAANAYIGAALRESENMFKAVFERSGIGIALIDNGGQIINSNPALQRMLGRDAGELNSLAHTELLHVDDVEEDSRKMSALNGGDIGHYTVEQRLLRRDGTAKWASVVVTAVHDAHDDILFRVAMVEDITEKKRMSEELSYQARHDPLTGLVNRRAFEDRLSRVLATADTEGSTHALCYLDLDQFKVINDTCGHAAGDELLRQLGVMLPTHVRTRDTLARLGGDEFGILMEHCPLPQAERVAGAIHTSFEEFRFFWDEKSFTVGVSIGLVPIHGPDMTVADVLSAADSACYAAKESGRNRLHVYRQDDHELQRRHTEMQWFTRIGRALDEDHFELHYQSIIPVDDTDSDLEHYEILLRLREEDGNRILPGAFLQAAERYGFAARIDRWVIDKSLAWLADDRSRLDRLGLCAINLSGQSLGDAGLLSYILERLQFYAMPGDRLCLEITETAMIANLPQAQQLISTLRQEGIRFALDDFGSGFASFAYLKNLAVDFVKIDGIFVRDIEHDEIDRAMVRSINQIGQVLGMQTIAEFVENERILAELGQIGVDFAQGYGIHRPQPLMDL